MKNNLTFANLIGLQYNEYTTMQVAIINGDNIENLLPVVSHKINVYTNELGEYCLNVELEAKERTRGNSISSRLMSFSSTANIKMNEILKSIRGVTINNINTSPSNIRISIKDFDDFYIDYNIRNLTPGFNELTIIIRKEEQEQN